MSSNSDDIQAAGSDTRPPMLDRNDYNSWDTLGTTPEGGVLLGPERPRTYDDLNDNEKKRSDADVRATNILLQGLPKDIYKLINHNIEAKAIWNNVKMLLAGSELAKEDRESQLYDEFKRFKMLPDENINEYYVRFHKLVNDMRNIIQENGAVLDEKELLFLTGEQTNNFDADVDDHPVRDLALNNDNIFQADECDAFDSNVDDEPTTQSIFMANLSSAGPTN
nr:integrase, catalytic region, zinc finger, CCHC-type, peptidase aspartic, catalytic [Tanacetum cinerariifolium]